MPFVTWDDSFLLNIPQFDEHHRHLVDLLNHAHYSFTSGEPGETVDTLLDKLVDYATYHFSAEEHWMKQYGFPGFVAHAEEHNRFTAKVIAMMKEPHLDPTLRLLELLDFLQDWLTNHILKTDAEYGRFVDTVLSSPG